MAFASATACGEREGVQVSIVDPCAASDAPPSDAALASFLIAGFEGADHRNSRGQPVDMIAATQHAANVERDYARVRAIGIRVIRESVGWWRSERDGRIDLDDARRRAEAAHRAGLSVIWTLWHYGWPEDLSLFDDALPLRFADFARRAVAAVADPSEPRPLFSPINEISFLAWAVTESTLIHPFRGGNAGSRADGYALKKRLVLAALAGCAAIRDAVPGARFVHADPLVHIVAPQGEPDRAGEAAHVRAFQFQAWDMLSGRTEPQLGGAASYVDFVGVNYYHANQFEVGTERRLHWHLGDPRRVAFRHLLHEVHERYQRPVIVAETSHFGIGRGRWLTDIACEARGAIDEGARIAGICLYPITDRPDWENASHWHHSGMWDRTHGRDGLERDRLNLAYLRALRNVQSDAGDAWRPSANSRDRAHGAMLVVLASGWNALRQAQRDRFEALARLWRIIVVEPGDHEDAATTKHVAGIRFVGRSVREDDDADDVLSDAIAAVLEQIASNDVRRVGVWLQAALDIPMLEHVAPDVVVYEPDARANAAGRADPRFLQRHRALLSIAGVRVSLRDSAIDVAKRVAAARRRGLSSGACATIGIGTDRNPRRLQEIACDCLIIGAGAIGLAAAHAFGEGSLLVEADITPGGSRRSIDDLGFVFDAAPTIIDRRGRTLDPLYEALLGNNLAWHDKRVLLRGDRTTAGRHRDPGFAARNQAIADARPERIGYPLRGGMQALIDGFLPLLGGDYLPHATVARIEPARSVVRLDDGGCIRYRHLIATLPLPALISMLRDAAPPRIAEAASRLRTVSLRCVNIGVRGAAPSIDWIAFGAETPFDRVVFRRDLALADATDRFGVVCELPHSTTYPLPANGSALVGDCIDACMRNGVFDRRDAVVVAHEIETPVAAVVDSDAAQANLTAIDTWLARHRISFAGSRGRWEPGRTFDAIIEGRMLARDARAALQADAFRHALPGNAAKCQAL